MLSAKKKWRKLDGQNRLPETIQGIEFRDALVRPLSKLPVRLRWA